MTWLLTKYIHKFKRQICVEIVLESWLYIIKAEFKPTEWRFIYFWNMQNSCSVNPVIWQCVRWTENALLMCVWTQCEDSATKNRPLQWTQQSAYQQDKPCKTENWIILSLLSLQNEKNENPSIYHPFIHLSVWPSVRPSLCLHLENTNSQNLS